MVFDAPLNTIYNERTPFLTMGDSALFFASDRPGGYGGFDLYVSFKEPSGRWGKVYNLGAPINTAANEQSIAVTKDGNVIYFASDRADDGAFGRLDIYMARFVP